MQAVYSSDSIRKKNRILYEKCARLSSIFCQSRTISEEQILPEHVSPSSRCQHFVNTLADVDTLDAIQTEFNLVEFPDVSSHFGELFERMEMFLDLHKFEKKMETITKVFQIVEIIFCQFQSNESFASRWINFGISLLHNLCLYPLRSPVQHTDLALKTSEEYIALVEHNTNDCHLSKLTAAGSILNFLSKAFSTLPRVDTMERDNITTFIDSILFNYIIAKALPTFLKVKALDTLKIMAKRILFQIDWGCNLQSKLVSNAFA